MQSASEVWSVAELVSFRLSDFEIDLAANSLSGGRLDSRLSSWCSKWEVELLVLG